MDVTKYWTGYYMYSDGSVYNDAVWMLQNIELVIICIVMIVLYNDAVWMLQNYWTGYYLYSDDSAL